MFKKYLDGIFRKASTNDASERTYYPVLESLLQNYPKDSKDYSILVEAKNTSIGIPDFKIGTPKNLLIGYIEAKDLGRDLDHLGFDAVQSQDLGSRRFSGSKQNSLSVGEQRIEL